MYRETYEQYEEFGKSDLKDYLDKDYVEDFLCERIDEWLDDVIDYDIENDYARDFISDEIDKKEEKELSESIVFLKTLLNKPENKDLTICEAWENEEDRIRQILADSEKYKEQVKENISEYMDNLDLFDDFWEEMKDECKDELLEYIDDGIAYSKDPYAYNGVNERDFF